MRTCSICGVAKPLDEFHRNRNDREGRAAACKPCATARARAWEKAHPERALATRESWAKINREPQNREARNRKEREAYAADPDKAWAAKMKYRYNLTTEQFYAMAEAQHGLCALCHRPPGRGRFHVDHCHTTGGIRALLCRPCNQGLGFFEDSTNLLQAAVLYLDRYPPYHPPPLPDGRVARKKSDVALVETLVVHYDNGLRKQSSMTPEEVESYYQRLKKVRARLEKAEEGREQAAAERAELWESLLGAGEKHVAIARASGVHKSYINKELTRRAAKKAG